MALTTRARRWMLVAMVGIEMIAAAWARWPLTTAPIKTQVEYQLGQIVITSERWREEGAIARHLLPSRSTDHRLPEWAYYDHDYVTVPPLSFVAHYVAARGFGGVDPVVLAKLVAQVQIFAGLLVATALLYTTFSFWPTLLAMSFLIWTTPFLVWFINGYFPTTTALLVQLVFIAWALPRVRAWAAGRRAARAGRREALVAGGLAALGAASEAICLAVNAAFFLVFVAMAWRAPRGHGRRWWTIAAAIAGATALTLAVIVGLYATVSDFGTTFADRLERRSGVKYGRPSAVAHAGVIWRQMQTAWPEPWLLALSAALAVVVAWVAVTLWRRSPRIQRARASVYAAALVLGFVPSVIYHYVLQNHVSIHWWFSGTWAIGWALTIASVADLARRLLFQLWRNRRMRSVVYPSLCAAALALSIAAYVKQVDLAGWSRTLADSFPMDVYRTLGAQLPADGYPLVATHFVQADLFTHYPFTTAHIRRPVVLLTGDRLLLPWGDEPADVHRLEEIPFAYVAYNPYRRRCVGDDVSIAQSDWLRVCRVAMRELLNRRSAILEREDRAPVGHDARHAPAAPGAALPSSVTGPDRLLAEAQSAIDRGGPLPSRAALMIMAGMARTTDWIDRADLQRIVDLAGTAPEVAEPVGLLRAVLEGSATDPSLGSRVIQAGGGTLSPADMHGDATLEGLTVHPLGADLNEVTLYFRPLRQWSGRLWVHAYPPGSSEYIALDPVGPAAGGWKPGDLAWAVFHVPASTPYNAYAGIATGDDLGPAYPLGWIAR